MAVPPGTTYVAGNSQIIPPTSSAATAAFSVPACPGSAADAIPGTALFCEVQPSEFAPAASVPPRSAGTAYYVHLMLDGSQMPGTSQIFNNHIPLDEQLTGSIALTKTTPMVNVTRGQLVPYVITMNNVAGQDLDWFWREWIYTTARLDQAVDSVRAVGRDSTYIFLSNRAQMVLPVTLQLRYADGTTDTKVLPVEMWYLGDRFTARFATPKAVTGVVLDPTAVLPDENRANNRWTR